MDGLTLLRSVQQFMGELDLTSWQDVKYTYDCLYEAAMKTADRTGCLTTTQSVTTIASTSNYPLHGNFLRLYLTDEKGDLFVRYYNTTVYSKLYHKPYNYIFMGNRTTSVSVPDNFSITDAAALSVVSSTTTSAGALTNGECTLTDSTKNFLFTGTTPLSISPGDSVIDVTTGALGIITAITSATALVCGLFNITTGAAEGFASGDSYQIIPQGRYQLVVDPPNSTASHTITVPYVYRPNPVYNYYRAYPFPQAYKDCMVAYACWKYKYRNQEPNFGDGFYKYWDTEVQRLSASTNAALNRRGYRVRFTKPANRDGSDFAS